MSTATVPLEIVCPEWCKVSPADHASELWDLGGHCIHTAEDVVVKDPVGYREALQEPRFEDPVCLTLSTMARPGDNRECASPVVYINGVEHTVGQALAVSEAIVALVDRYRAAGGTA